MIQMYIIALDYGVEGWKLSEPYENLSKVMEAIMNGATYGQKFKVFKDIVMHIVVSEKE